MNMLSKRLLLIVFVVVMTIGYTRIYTVLFSKPFTPRNIIDIVVVTIIALFFAAVISKSLHNQER